MLFHFAAEHKPTFFLFGEIAKEVIGIRPSYKHFASLHIVDTPVRDIVNLVTMAVLDAAVQQKLEADVTVKVDK
ncbi:MAG: hypothetical protein K2L55_08195 [Muribaculaceae bacterium]|nr:hypothetical protein [Muribaculaceae bacterium]